MRVAQVKELLSAYSDNDELMIAWNDRTQFEYVLDKELPIEIWQQAVKTFDLSDLQHLNDQCHGFVLDAVFQLETIQGASRGAN